MPQFARIPDPLPDWLSAVHDNSYLSAKDLAKLFGVVPNAIHTRVTVCSDFPKPRHFGGRETPAGVKPLTRWRAGDIRAWIAKRKAEGNFSV